MDTTLADGQGHEFEEAGGAMIIIKLVTLISHETEFTRAEQSGSVQ